MSSLVGRGAAWGTKAVSEKAFPESTREVGARVLKLSLGVTDFFNRPLESVIEELSYFIFKKAQEYFL